MIVLLVFFAKNNRLILIFFEKINDIHRKNIINVFNFLKMISTKKYLIRTAMISASGSIESYFPAMSKSHW